MILFLALIGGVVIAALVTLLIVAALYVLLSGDFRSPI